MPSAATAKPLGVPACRWRVFALRFLAYGERQYVTLGSEAKNPPGQIASIAGFVAQRFDTFFEQLNDLIRSFSSRARREAVLRSHSSSQCHLEISDDGQAQP